MAGTLRIFFKWLLIMLVGIYRDESKEVNIETNIGSLIGETDHIQFDGEHKHVTRFLGIPYAKPPIGARRFMKPERLDSTFSKYNATFHRPHCMQSHSYKYMKIYQQSENCLYLNIYIPGTDIRDTNAIPVMIYIHGGSFYVGGADVYSGDILSAFRNVIVVTINYRLNIFGFLSNGEKLSGNYGLWDMKLAIQWVHDNIKSFGGDPDSVTLFGNSAGGAAVTYQAIHPGNKGLFHRVIAQSGSCFASWALQKKPEVNFNWYVASVGCDFIEYSDVLSCLRSKSANDLATRATKFVPVVDKDFLLESPYELSLRRSEAGRSAMNFFTSLDFLNGVTSSDGAYALGDWSARIAKENWYMDSNYSTDLSDGVPSYFYNTKYIPELLSDICGNVLKALTQRVIHQYTNWSDPDNPVAVRNKLVEIVSDVTFFVPGLYASKLHNGMKNNVTLEEIINSDENALNARPMTRQTNTFFYVFNHKPSFAPEPKWLTGATHVMELPYVFGFPKSLEWKLIQDYYMYVIDPFTISQEDIALSHQMMTFWANFAKNGNPNLKQSTSTATEPFWPSFDKEKQQYLDITANITSVKHHLAASRIAFWETVLKNCEYNSASVLSVSTVCCILLIYFVENCFDIFTRH